MPLLGPATDADAFHDAGSPVQGEDAIPVSFGELPANEQESCVVYKKCRGRNFLCTTASFCPFRFAAHKHQALVIVRKNVGNILGQKSDTPAAA
jgi:hypothetical protein